MNEQELRVLRRALSVWWPEGEWIDPGLGLEDYVAFKFRLVLESDEGVSGPQARMRGWEMFREVIGPDPESGWRRWQSLEELRQLAVAYLERADEEDSEAETSE